jgi:sigma-B regulation protein RsbU (phosphoserine phosphatase)
MAQILIIENDLVIRKLLKKMLQVQGYDVVEAASGEEGLVKLRSFQPLLILCEWKLPGISGLTICQKIKADHALSSIYFIFLTARRPVEQHIQALDSGADDFLTKPIQIAELSARVRAGLRVYQALQAQRRLTQVLETEMAEASEYVRSLLPPPMTGAITIRSHFLPSRHLGGDCFDYRWLDEDWLSMYLLDVSGHGLGAALLSVSVQNILRTQVLPDVNFYQPGLVLTALNEAFATENSERYFTIWYGTYDRRRRLLFYASAGHPPAILLSGHESEMKTQQLRTPGTPIGMFSEMRYASQCCKVEANSTLYLFSDGIYDLPQSDQSWGGLENWIRFLTNHHQGRSLSSPEKLVEQVQQTTNCQEFEDDCSLLQVQFS